MLVRKERPLKEKVILFQSQTPTSFYKLDNSFRISVTKSHLLSVQCFIWTPAVGEKLSSPGEHGVEGAKRPSRAEAPKSPRGGVRVGGVPSPQNDNLTWKSRILLDYNGT